MQASAIRPVTTTLVVPERTDCDGIGVFGTGLGMVGSAVGGAVGDGEQPPSTTAVRPSATSMTLRLADIVPSLTHRPSPGPAGRNQEAVVVAAVLAAGSEKAAAHRLGLSHSTVKHHLANARTKVGAETTAQLVWILAPRLLEPEARTDE